MPLNRKTLLSLPHRKWDIDSIYDSIILVPTGKKHDSGWSYIAIVGEIKGKPKEIAAFCDDVCWKNIPSDGYSFRTDSFYPSGLMHFWSKFAFKVGHSLSSTDITLIPK